MRCTAHVGRSGGLGHRRSETETPVDQEARSSSGPELMDRVQSRLQRLSMVVDGVRIRLTPRPGALRAGRGPERRPRRLALPAAPRPPGLHRHRVDLRRRLAPQFALQVRGARHVVLRGAGERLEHVLAAPRGRRRLRRHDPVHPGLVRAGPDPAAPPRGAHPDPGRHAGALDRPPARWWPRSSAATCSPTPPRAK